MRSRTTTTAWYLRAQELLADGEWHDGRSLLLEAGKVITPGVAQRQTERLRVASGGPAQRTRPLPLGRQIEQGKRYLLTEMVRMRVKAGTWETEPPYPFRRSMFDPDPDKAWRVRLLRGTAFLSVPEVADRFGVNPATLRKLIRAGGLPAENVGTKGREMLRIHADDLPLYEKAAKEWLATEDTRLSDKNRRSADSRVESNIARYLTGALGASNDSPMRRVRWLVTELTRLRGEYAVLRAENARLRDEVKTLRGDIT